MRIQVLHFDGVQNFYFLFCFFLFIYFLLLFICKSGREREHEEEGRAEGEGGVDTLLGVEPHAGLHAGSTPEP